MSERPKTLAQIAEEQGLLPEELLDNISINKLQERIGCIRNDIHEIQSKLGWIVSLVNAVYRSGISTDLNITDELLNNLLTIVEELDTKALKVGDILVADRADI